MDAIHGLTIEAMAETMSKHNELRAQHGEPAFKPYFLRYLATKGVDEHAWGQAWNSWHTRMDADKSGQLWARFNAAQTALTMQAHFGDVADMSQEARGGLTLDMYARLSAEAAQPGADFAALLARHGVSEAVWNAGRDAWNLAMSQDTMHRITTQYGQLYARYNPAHVAAMQAQAAQMIANRPESSAQEEEPEVEYTVEAALAELKSPVPRTRWRAAHLLAQKIQTELEGDRARQRQALAACVPQLLDCLDRHDKETVSSAEAAARDLVELGQTGDEAKGAVTRCLLRGREHLATVQAAFAPIQNKNVPERIYLQSEIQDYTSLVETLEQLLADWNDAGGDADDAPAAAGQAADEGIASKVEGARSLWDRIMSLFR
jgi:hypothetical protein